MPYLPNSITIILGISTLITVILYIREYFLRKKDASSLQKISISTKQKSIQLLNAAEMAETQIISDSNYITQKLISEYKTQLQSLIETSGKSITSSQDQLIKFIANLQTRSDTLEKTSKDITEKKINDLFERLENRLSDFLIQAENKTTTSLELELKASRELIETYKTQQLKLIDENILAMMEQTLNIVLSKKLSLNDQLDLIYESLEKAKLEKFIV